MKSKYFAASLFILILAAPAPSHARMGAETITVDPVSLVFNWLGGEYQHNLSPDSAMTVRAGFYFWNYSGWSSSGIMGGMGYRGYFQRAAPNGPYWEAGANMVVISAKYNVGSRNDSGSSVLLGPDASLGFAHSWPNGFYVDGRLGVNYMVGSLKVGNESFPFGGFGYGLGVGLGIRF
jgi:hypothetical protein